MTQPPGTPPLIDIQPGANAQGVHLKIFNQAWNWEHFLPFAMFIAELEEGNTITSGSLHCMCVMLHVIITRDKGVPGP